MHIADADANGHAADSYTHGYRNSNAYPDTYGAGHSYTYSAGYGYTYRDADWYTHLHAWLVCRGTHAHSRGALGWCLFPGQRKVLCDGWAQCRHSRQRFYSPV